MGKGPIGPLILLAFVFFLAVKFAPAKPEVHKTPEQKAQETRENERFWTGVRLVALLKKTMKDPDSFELAEAVHMPEGTLCVTYRARNSFNAKVPAKAVLNTKVFSTSETSGFYVNWNKYCAGFRGDDETSKIKIALGYL